MLIVLRANSATIEERLLSAECILKQGKQQVIICERGIATFECSTSDTLDLSAVPMLKKLNLLPVVVDPSRAVGLWLKVPTLAKAAAIEVGTDGLLMEVNCERSEALSDGPQFLNPEQFRALMTDVITERFWALDVTSTKLK